MTREIEIIRAAQMCARNYGGENLVELAFKKGAEWADRNPKSPWISVEDRLPEIKKRVLFLCNNGKAYFGYNNIDNDSATITNAPEGVKVTHWMPIPLLSKGGEK